MRLLRRRLTGWSKEKGIDLRLVPLLYAGDNAAMIGHAGLVLTAEGWVAPCASQTQPVGLGSPATLQAPLAGPLGNRS